MIYSIILIGFSFILIKNNLIKMVYQIISHAESDFTMVKLIVHGVYQST